MCAHTIHDACIVVRLGFYTLLREKGGHSAGSGTDDRIDSFSAIAAMRNWRRANGPNTLVCINSRFHSNRSIYCGPDWQMLGLSGDKYDVGHTRTDTHILRAPFLFVVSLVSFTYGYRMLFGLSYVYVCVCARSLAQYVLSIDTSLYWARFAIVPLQRQSICDLPQYGVLSKIRLSKRFVYTLGHILFLNISLSLCIFIVFFRFHCVAVSTMPDNVFVCVFHQNSSPINHMLIWERFIIARPYALHVV